MCFDGRSDIPNWLGVTDDWDDRSDDFRKLNFINIKFKFPDKHNLLIITSFFQHNIKQFYQKTVWLEVHYNSDFYFSNIIFKMKTNITYANSK